MFHNLELIMLDLGRINTDYLYADGLSTNPMNYSVRPIVKIPLYKVKVGIDGDGSIGNAYSVEVR